MRRLVAVATLAVLAGCSASTYDLAELAPETSSVVTAASPSPSAALAYVARAHPRFDDNDPHDWQSRAPWHHPVHGTDVAKYQEYVDWQKVRTNGISFAFIKATEGGDIVDDYFERNWKAARQAGIARGAYHFFYFCRPAIEQARWFIRNVPRDPNALPPVLDMEWNPFSPTCTKRPPAAKVQSEMRIFLEALERHYGKKPIIYTSIDFFDDNRLENFKGYPYWLRSVAGHPDEKYGNHPFVFWQYTGTGVIPGIDGDADINVFNGTKDEWRVWLAENTS
ncbi:glycoside hydrolase family 25 protein [Mesorhizobium xinjiangense]|uniref:glycoside hydrolase family 25 protein n=1 Tax=Mesorhizobium xinjiangense TaxID=2678685 RepID=UPI0012ED44FD|nr:GH25 family lysozyme [Mesorhizobium xinjiangense]